MSKNEYPLISYWSEDTKEVYEDGDFAVIVGVYNHKNAEEKPNVCVGVHWRDYPIARNTLAPCVVKRSTGIDILNGRLQRIANNNELETEKKFEEIEKVINALERLKTNR